VIRRLLGSDPVIDGEATDWGVVPIVPLNELCVSCGDPDNPGNRPGFRIWNYNTRPGPLELTAHFAVGWTSGGIYVLIVARDDEIYPAPGSADAPLPADQVDGVELFVDGVIEGIPDEGLGPYAHHVFVGVNGAMSAPWESVDPRQYITAVANRNGDCYLLEAKLPWDYLREISVNKPPPKSGDVMRFDVGVNDWDGDPARREYQVLWRDPGGNYANVTDEYPMVILGD
jgi:hypothetical protein